MNYPNDRLKKDGRITWVNDYCEITEDGRVSRECVERNWKKSILAKHPLRSNYRQPEPFTGHAVCDEDDGDDCDAHRDTWHPDVNPWGHFTDDFITSYLPDDGENDVTYIN
ncbi:hypothetical protein [Natrinema marinum]|uniref:hypothetical protein n=1 Tax=Natrinema marinum TaxID=2961598 RepID=UPI0020C85566|nr:hypothetical protein [Natrinema marinum]